MTSTATPRSRRLLTGLCLMGAVVPVSLGATGIASATAPGGSGHFLTPFREDGATYNAATNTFTGGRYNGARTDTNGCIPQDTAHKNTGAPAGNPDAYDCLPAGASMVQLANGKVVFWNALEGEERITGSNTLLTDGGRLTVNDESRLLNLSGSTPAFTKPSPVDAGAHQTDHPDDLPLGPFSAKHYAYNNGSMFCSDQVLLGDGSVIDAGGTDYYQEPYLPVVDKGVVELQGVRNTRIYDPSRNAWTAGPKMNYGRWYPSLVTLGSGDLFVASGVGKLIKPVYPTRPQDSGTNVKQTETLDLKSAKWLQNPATADRSLPLFPRLHLLPNGHVYYDAAGQSFNPAGQSYDEATWNTAASYDPTTKSWTDLGVPGVPGVTGPASPAGVAGAPFAGFRGSTFSAALTMRPSSVDAAGRPTYDKASYLTAGGVLALSPGSYVAVADSRISTVSSTGKTDTMTTTPTGPLNQGRWYGTATPLPNGQVFVTSGADVDEVDAPGTESPILTTELFTPTYDKNGTYTGGTWQVVGKQARKRTYHNNAVLRPDGSVLIGGHAPIAFGYYQTTDGIDTPVRAGTNNHHDASFQDYQPAYVNDPARPSVTGVNATTSTITVHTKDAASIASVVLMRNTAETHLVDGDARTVSLPVLKRTGDTVIVGLPTSTNVLPNGPYQLFANKAKDGNVATLDANDLLPSNATQLFITGSRTPAVFLPHAAKSVASSDETQAGDNSTDETGTSGSQELRTSARHHAPDQPGSTVRAQRSTKARQSTGIPVAAPAVLAAATRSVSGPATAAGGLAAALTAIGGVHLLRRLRRATRS